MDARQRNMLVDLIGEWAGIVHDTYAAPRFAEIRNELEDTVFAWRGPTTREPGRNGAAYFRIQSPSVLIEFAPQEVGGDPTLHVHTVYRNPRATTVATFLRTESPAMLNRRSFLLSGALVTAAAVLSSGRAGAQSQPAYLLGATAITQVFGDGQRLVAVALRYDGALAAAALDPTLYAVDGRTILRVHACASANPADENTDGPFVILVLSPEDDAAQLYRLRQGGGTLRLPAAASVTLTPKDVLALDFGSAAPNGEAATGDSGRPPGFGSEPLSVATNDVRNLVVDEFVQHDFHNSATGDTLAYNLFVPRDHNPAVPLPLVLFMHDAGVTGPVVDTTLVQGLGAVSWAFPEDQARRPCIIVAPQYRAQIVNDASQTTFMLDTTLRLLDSVARDHGADRNRLYATGQSGGGMMAIAMMILEPERFAAAFLVACQWDPALVAPLARQKLWVVVSEGDEGLSRPERHHGGDRPPRDNHFACDMGRNECAGSLRSGRRSSIRRGRDGELHGFSTGNGRAAGPNRRAGR